jgi:hypothetical protein
MNQKLRFTVINAWTVLVVALTSLSVLAGDQGSDSMLAEPLDFKINANLSSKVIQPDAGHMSVHLNNGTTQQIKLPAAELEGRQRLEAEDFNFDGHMDLALVTAVGMVNERYQLFLFNPAISSFRPLKLNTGTNSPNGNCEELSSIQTKAIERTLLSHCRSGAIWYTDAYRYGPDQKLYLYQTQRFLPHWLPLVMDYDDSSDGPTWLVQTFDPTGKKTAQQITAYEGGSASLMVQRERLALHEKPDTTPTHRYLVKGDQVKVDDLSDDEQWLKVEFTNPKKGVIVGWVAVEDIAPARHEQP